MVTVDMEEVAVQSEVIGSRHSLEAWCQLLGVGLMVSHEQLVL